MHWILFFLLLITTNICFGQNLGFRFKDGYCQKNKKPGHNPNFEGECGMLTKTLLIKRKWKNLKLNGINLNSSNLYRVQFEKLEISHASLRRGYIRDSKFTSINAPFLDLRGSFMQGGQWKDSNLQSWIAIGSRINKTSFLNCDLRSANFWGSNLQQVNFTGSDLRGANLKNTHTLFSIFKDAQFNSKTQLPFSKEEALKKGMVEVD